MLIHNRIYRKRRINQRYTYRADKQSDESLNSRNYIFHLIRFLEMQDTAIYFNFCSV